MHFITLPWRILRRFLDERCAQTAAALAFATLLGLVPMIAVAAAILSHLPLADSLGSAVQKFLLANFLPEKAGTIIARYVSEFAHKAGRLTWIGIGALAFTAIMQMLTIEHAFNGIWRVQESRPFLRRVVMHVVALLLGPVVFGISLALTTYLATASIGLVAEWRGATAAVLRALSFVILATFFGLLYWKVPNRQIKCWHAACGGIFAAVGFAFLQWLFASYVSGISGYRVVYGAFAAIPIFLVWLYLSWGVILIGALLTAEVETRRGRR
ncbi:MAG: YihY family inner membrane protein [Rhodocyclaceae bacterium]|nr:YihY family inner membrane protein [Rhodocyclaceae bacterium]